MKLDVSQATKSYGKKRALDGVSVTVDGGIVGLLGMNGAGKSTLFRAMLDLLPLDAGTITVDGLDSRRDSLEIRRRLGYLPEDSGLDELLTGAETLELVAALKGIDADGGERREWLRYFGLEAAADLLVGAYSLGMRKKLGLIVALLGRPRLVLLDEPLNALDVGSMDLLRRRLLELAAEGSTIVLSSHYLSFVERFCDRHILLHQGRLMADGSSAELRAQAGRPEATLDEAFLALTGQL
jgi:ABC-type multidrug transport system ATPase subunit